MSTLEHGSNKNAGDIKILLMVFFYRLGVTFPMQRQSASDIPSQPTTTKTDTGMLKRCQTYITQDMLSALCVVPVGCCYNVYINCPGVSTDGNK